MTWTFGRGGGGGGGVGFIAERYKDMTYSLFSVMNNLSSL